jgi:hypothetical protein
MRAYAVEGLRTPIVKLRSTVQQLELEVNGDTATATVVGHGCGTDCRHWRSLRSERITARHRDNGTVEDVSVRTSAGWRRRAHTKTIGNQVTAIDRKA